MAKIELDEDDHQESNVSAYLAFLVALAGIILIIVSIVALLSDALWAVDRLVKFNASFENSMPPITTRRIFALLIVAGSFIIVAALIGIIGAKSRVRILLSIYVITAFCFSMLAVVGSIQAIQRRNTVEPMIIRQVNDFCNGTTYKRLFMNLGCSGANLYAEPLPACNVFCQSRVQTLERLDGCKVLPMLCKHFEYQQLSSTECANMLAQSSSMMIAKYHQSEDACRDHCDQNVLCDRFMFLDSSAGVNPYGCFLNGGSPTNQLFQDWIRIQPSQAINPATDLSYARCFSRTESIVSTEFRSEGVRLAVFTLIVSVTLVLSLIYTCCQMYNVSMKRDRQPNGCELAGMVFCPCCTQGLYEKYNSVELSDEE